VFSPPLPLTAEGASSKVWSLPAPQPSHGLMTSAAASSFAEKFRCVTVAM
jgi:hypothetical protein